MAVKIKPYTEALGAEVLNINLGRKLSDSNLSLIKDTLNKYHVLFFRDQGEISCRSEPAYRA